MTIDKKLSLYDACAAYLAQVALAAIAEEGEPPGSANEQVFTVSVSGETAHA